MPKVSVVMTVYNGERFVEDALKSLLAQTYQDFETIVVDDGSTDRTAEIVRGHTSERVHLLSPGRLGRIRALNYGVAAAQGEYIAILDADDLARPTRLEREVELLDAHPEIGLVGTGYRRLHYAGKSEDYPCPENHPPLRRALVHGMLFHHSTAMYRRGLFERVGGYDERLACCEDHDLFLRLTRVSRLGGINEILCIRRITGENYYLTVFSPWRRLHAILCARYRNLRGICPLMWWFFWLAPAVPGRVRRWLGQLLRDPHLRGAGGGLRKLAKTVVRRRAA